MNLTMKRRAFLNMLSSSMIMPYSLNLAAYPLKNFRIRTITAGVELNDLADFDKIEKTVDFLTQAKSNFQEEGYEVQTLRVATQPLSGYMPGWRKPGSIPAIQSLDRLAGERGIILSLGPVITGNHYFPDIGAWATELIQATKNSSFTIVIASPERGILPLSIRSAAEAINAISGSVPGGEGNFRFAATAFVPPGTPFFPAAYHRGVDSFSIGLETPNLLKDVFKSLPSQARAGEKLKARMNDALGMVETLALGMARYSGLRYLGIDTSPAPGPDASIGEAIETLTEMPFGSASTLSACATITDTLKSLKVMSCGYSGLMLPVVEDSVLAKRAAEGRFSISELLLYSSVCGAGLDVVPLPGDIGAETLASIIGDVAALATKYQKPLSARLFPIPGKSAGDLVQFNNPFLTDSVVWAPKMKRITFFSSSLILIRLCRPKTMTNLIK